MAEDWSGFAPAFGGPAPQGGLGLAVPDVEEDGEDWSQFAPAFGGAPSAPQAWRPTNSEWMIAAPEGIGGDWREPEDIGSALPYPLIERDAGRPELPAAGNPAMPGLATPDSLPERSTNYVLGPEWVLNDLDPASRSRVVESRRNLRRWLMPPPPKGDAVASMQDARREVMEDADLIGDWRNSAAVKQYLSQDWYKRVFKVNELEQLTDFLKQRMQKGGVLLDETARNKLGQAQRLIEAIRQEGGGSLELDDPFEMLDLVINKYAPRANERYQRLLESEIEEARAENPTLLAGNELGGVGQGLLGAGVSLASPIMRAVGQGEEANRLQDRLGVLLEAQQRNVAAENYGPISGFLNRNIPGVTQSGVQAVALAPLGFGAMATGFGVTTANDSYRQAIRSGLPEREALKYGLTQGAIEAGVMSVFHKAGKLIPGLGGFEEKLTKGITRRVTQESFGKAFRRISLEVNAELAEEIATSIAQQLNTALTLPGAEGDMRILDSKGNIDWNAPLTKTIVSTVEQTLLTMGLAEGAQKAIARFKDSPTRSNYDAMPTVTKVLEPEGPTKVRESEEQRRRYAETLEVPEPQADSTQAAYPEITRPETQDTGEGVISDGEEDQGQAQGGQVGGEVRDVVPGSQTTVPSGEQSAAGAGVELAPAFDPQEGAYRQLMQAFDEDEPPASDVGVPGVPAPTTEAPLGATAAEVPENAETVELPETGAGAGVMSAPAFSESGARGRGFGVREPQGISEFRSQISENAQQAAQPAPATGGTVAEPAETPPPPALASRGQGLGAGGQGLGETGETTAREAEPLSPAGDQAAAPASRTEPWQMARSEYLESQLGRPGSRERKLADQAAIDHVASIHKAEVRAAIRDGKTVPPSVLAEYPDLKPKKSLKKSAEPRSTAKEPSNVVPAQSVEAQTQFAAGQAGAGRVQARAGNQAVEADQRADDSEVREAGSGRREESLADRVASLPVEARQVAESALTEIHRLRREALSQPDDKAVARDAANAEKALLEYLDAMPTEAPSTAARRDAKIATAEKVTAPKVATQTARERVEAEMFEPENEQQLKAVARSVSMKPLSADDVWQQAQLNMLERADTLKPDEPFLPWATRTVQNAARDLGRRESHQRSLKAVEDAVELTKQMVRKHGRRANTPGGEFLVDMANLTKAWLKAGVLTFRDFIERLAEHFDHDVLIQNGPAIERMWATVKERGTFPGMSDSSSVADLLKPKPTSTPKAVEPSQAANEETFSEQPVPLAEEDDEPSTSIQNARVAEHRAELGMPERDPVETVGHTFEELQAEARQVDPKVVTGLIAELSAKPRPVTDAEDFQLLNRQAELLLENERTLKDLQAAQESGDVARVAELETLARVEQSLLEELFKVTEAVGTATARGLNARKALLKFDFSLARLRYKARAARGQDLDGTERAALEAAYAKFDEAMGKLKAAEEKIAALESENEILRQIKEHGDRVARATPATERAAKQKRLDAAFARAGKALKFYSTPLDPEALAAGVELAKAFIDLKVFTFKEFLSRVAQRFGKTNVEKHRETFQAAWNQAKAVMPDAGKPPRLDFDGENSRSVSRAAKALARFFIENGVVEVDPLIDAVHGELTKTVPELTRSEARDAISGYGQFSELSKDPIDVQLKDLAGQMQQFGKLEDMQQGQAPRKTGMERRPVSDKERHLIQQVEEAKRRGGYVVTDPAKQLKSALDARKKYLENRLADLRFEISQGTRTVKTKTPSPTDARLEELRAEYAAVKAEHAEVFGDRQASDASKLKAATEAAAKSLAEWQRRLATGDWTPKPTPTKSVTSAELIELRNQRDAARAEVEYAKRWLAAAEALAHPEKAEEALNARYAATLAKRMAELQRRMAEQDYAPRPPKAKRPLPEELVAARQAVEEAKQELNRQIENFRRKNLNAIGKGLILGRNLLNASRSIMLGLNVPVFLQGAAFAFRHPVLATKAFGSSMKSYASKDAAFAAGEELKARDNYANYVKSGLALTDTTTKQEELFLGEFSKHIPLVAGSERATMTFLNRARADYFDSLTAALAINGELTDAQMKAIAAFVNMATGRGDLGAKWNRSAENLATVFLAPRYVLSRFQLLAGKPLWEGDAATRLLFAKEYAKTLAAAGLVYALLSILKGDDDEPLVEFDPRSSRFLKIKLGDTMLDPTGGLSSVATWLTRIVWGESKDQYGRVVPLRGPNVKPMGMDEESVIVDMLRSKLAPLPKLFVNLATGKDMAGKPVTAETEFRSFTMPLLLADVQKAIEAQGVPKGLALSLLNFVGVGMNTHHSPLLDDKQALVLRAVKELSTEDKTKSRSRMPDGSWKYVTKAQRPGGDWDDLAIEAARKMLLKAVPNRAERETLLREAWEAEHGSIWKMEKGRPYRDQYGNRQRTDGFKGALRRLK